MAYNYNDAPVLSKIKIGNEYYNLKDKAARDLLDVIYADYLTSADKTELLGKITNEETRAKGVEGELQELIDALEEKVGTSSDTASAEGSLYARIKQEIADRAAAITQEVSDRNTAIANAINALDVTDTAEEGKYVSAVNEVDGKIVVSREDLPAADQYTIAKQASPETDMAATYYLTKNGTQVGEKINIPKDQFLKEAHFCKDASEVPSGHDVPTGTEFPAILFVFTTKAGDVDTWVSVKELVDVYTAGDGIDITGNEISAVAKSGDKYLEVTADGIASKGIDEAIAAAVLVETNRATAAENALDARLDVIEGADTVDGSIKKALKDAKAYTDAEVAEEKDRAEGVEDGLDTRLTAAEGDIDALEGRMTQAEADIDALEGRMTTAEADIDANTTAIAGEKSRAQGQEAAIRSEFAAADALKADKVSNATNGNFAGLDANGNLTDSGKKAADFATAGDLDALEARVDAAEADIEDLEENKADKTYVDGELAKKVNKTQKVAGIDLQDDITVAELQSALGLGDLAYADTASGKVSTIDTIVMNESTVSGNATVTSTATAATLSRGDYKPSGDVTVTLSNAGVLSSIKTAGTTPSFVDNKIGTFVAPSLQTGFVTAGSDASLTDGAVNQANDTTNKFVKKAMNMTVGTGDDAECLIISEVASTDTSFYGDAVTASGTVTYTAPVLSGGKATVVDTTKFAAGSWTAGTFNAGAMPTFNTGTVGVASAAFDGATEAGLKVTGVTYDKADASAAYSTVFTPSVKTYNRTEKTITVSPDAE